MTLGKILSGLLAGLLFGAGLAISGMTNPDKVLNFLDLTGTWDPSLALVMASAIPVSALAFWLARRRKRPLLEPGFVLPTNTRLETPLFVGSALFGIGWGLGGYCPGPAIASLSQPSVPLGAFLVAMTLGLLASGRVAGWLSPTGTVGPAGASPSAPRQPRG
uniref:DUF6691 family protein n=1 Tax=uncultured Caulobacter sp. TaxID=158749 RepID=UPI0025F04EBD|nr:DUF6691 family protein [uncultured Caulobacter sp.]